MFVKHLLYARHYSRSWKQWLKQESSLRATCKRETRQWSNEERVVVSPCPWEMSKQWQGSFYHTWCLNAHWSQCSDSLLIHLVYQLQNTCLSTPAISHSPFQEIFHMINVTLKKPLHFVYVCDRYCPAVAVNGSCCVINESKQSSGNAVTFLHGCKSYGESLHCHCSKLQPRSTLETCSQGVLKEDPSTAVGWQWDPKSLLGFFFFLLLFMQCVSVFLGGTFEHCMRNYLHHTLRKSGIVPRWGMALHEPQLSMSTWSAWIWLSAREIVTVCLDNLCLGLAWALSISAFFKTWRLWVFIPCCLQPSTKERTRQWLGFAYWATTTATYPRGVSSTPW